MKAICFKLSVLCWHEAFIAAVLTYRLFLDGKYTSVALKICLESARRMLIVTTEAL